VGSLAISINNEELSLLLLFCDEEAKHETYLMLLFLKEDKFFEGWLKGDFTIFTFY